MSGSPVRSEHRALTYKDLNVNHLYPADPPAVACAAYLRQWKFLRKKRSAEQSSFECKAKPRNWRVVSEAEKRMFYKGFHPERSAGFASEGVPCCST